MTKYLAYTRKLIAMIVSAVGTSAIAITLPQPWNFVVGGVSLVSLAFVHYLIPNTPLPPVVINHQTVPVLTVPAPAPVAPAASV